MDIKNWWRSLVKRKKTPRGSRRTRFAKRVLWVCGVLFVLIGLGWLMLPLAGHYLMVDQEPGRADVIVVLSGDRGERTEHGVRLFHAGVADRIIVSGGPVYGDCTAADLMYAHAVDLEVPAACIIKEAGARDTRENAYFVKALMESYGFNSAVVVSSPYHMRRVQLVFSRTFSDKPGVELTYSAAPGAAFDPYRWWETPTGKRLVLSELAKVMALRLPLPEAWYGYGDTPGD